MLRVTTCYQFGTENNLFISVVDPLSICQPGTRYRLNLCRMKTGRLKSHLCRKTRGHSWKIEKQNSRNAETSQFSICSGKQHILSPCEILVNVRACWNHFRLELASKLGDRDSVEKVPECLFWLLWTSKGLRNILDTSNKRHMTSNGTDSR